MNYSFLFLPLVFIPIITLAQTVSAPETEMSVALQKAENEVRRLQRQTLALKGQLRQESAQNQKLTAKLTNLNQLVVNKTDSIGRLQVNVTNQVNHLGRLGQNNQQIETVLTQTRTTLDSAYRQIARLRYDQDQLTNNRVVRIYQFPLVETRAILLRHLAKPESGFLFTHSQPGSEVTELTITRQFDGESDAWWELDAPLDTVFELTLRLTEHQFDPQRTLIYADTRLMQKIRFSNKPFEEQQEPEKVKLYRDHALRLLEGNLRDTSDK